MTAPPDLAARWPAFLGHALTVGTLALGGLSSFHAIRSDVVELRALITALVQTEADHTRRGEVDLRQLREEIRDLRSELRHFNRNPAKEPLP
ncbi:MAG: hypothetical protein K1X57_13955 [Gemmataceae bacterium]|nr:hypothetical protein [Gemmataceae bacterium]